MIDQMTKKELRDFAVKTIAADYEPNVVIQRRPYTYVHFAVEFAGVVYNADGFSKVSWPDTWDEMQGILYASQKAIRHIVRLVTKNRRSNLIALCNSLSDEYDKIHP